MLTHFLDDAPVGHRGARAFVLTSTTMDGEYRRAGISAQFCILQRLCIVFKSSDFACHGYTKILVKFVDECKNERKVVHKE